MPKPKQLQEPELPVIGAEVFIEPGQSADEIDGWFSLLKESGMTVTRIRMFENYMTRSDGSWDFSLFDLAFKAGEKYGIKIYANLFPTTELTDVGGFKFPKSEAHLSEIATYIEKIVAHFKQFSSLYGWVPINEPGLGSLPVDDFTRLKFVEWKMENHPGEYHDNGYVRFDLSDREFLIEYNIWFLEWLTNQILKQDPDAIIHVNNHDIFRNVAEYDFPRWSNFLTSLGGSAHASWHFGYFDRPHYAVAMSANSELIRSGAKNIPWLMTELQGGNNTYSGRVPLCPTKEEIAQWIWITIGAGSKGSIFWCLNPRSSGHEAGEWAMVDYQDQPTDRLLMAAEVAKVLTTNEVLFTGATVADAPIDVIYTRQSLWIEKVLRTEGASFEGRDEGASMKSALAYFEALSELGINAGFYEISAYDFSKESYKGKAMIIAHQISIPKSYHAKLEDFVAKGGKLILEGLSGFYDENAYFVLRKGFPMLNLCGAQVKEFKVVEEDFSFELNGVNLKGGFWQGILAVHGASELAKSAGEVVASKNELGAGTVCWLPTLVGLTARKTSNYKVLAAFLSAELKEVLGAQPVFFDQHYAGMLMKVLRHDQYYLTILVNKAKTAHKIELKGAISLQHPKVLFASSKGKADENTVFITPEETLVISWEFQISS